MTSKWIWLEALTFAQAAPNGAVRTGYALAAYADSNTGKNAYPSQSTLAGRLGISDRAVRKNLAWLKDAGWIVEERRGRRAGTQGISSSYSLTIPTGTEVPVGKFPTGTDIPHGNFPTGTFESPQPELLGSPTGTEVPTNQELTKQEPRRETRERVTTPVPENFEISDDMRSWADENGITVDLLLATKKFLAHNAAKGSTFKDWEQAWRTWMLREQEWRAPASPAPAKSWWDTNKDPHPHADQFSQPSEPDPSFWGLTEEVTS